jgi:hypothetical protein
MLFVTQDVVSVVMIHHLPTGPDGIPARLLHEYASFIAPAPTKIFQISVNTGTIPDEWRSALIVPVFKKGDRHHASNYRPVSLTRAGVMWLAYSWSNLAGIPSGPELFGIVLHASKYGVVDILVVSFPSLSLYCCFLLFVNSSGPT